MGAPRPYRVCKKRSKIMHLRRRRISSPIYTAARHYHHRLTCKDVPERCLAGFVAVGPQLDAYEGRRCHRLTGRLTAALVSCVLCCLCAQSTSCVSYVICQKHMSRFSMMIIHCVSNIFFDKCCTTCIVAAPLSKYGTC